MRFKTFAPAEKLPQGVILPEQIHGSKIVEIVTGQEDLTGCDGLWTRDQNKLLGIRTADCAPVCFWEETKFGILHVGWRGLVEGICEKMQTIFLRPQVWIGPFLPEFEIQRDICFEQITARFGVQFLKEEQGKLIFEFGRALQSFLPQAQFDRRNTFFDLNLASWRRDHTEQRNITVIGNF